MSAHWLLLASMATGLYIALPLAAPVLIHAGHERAGHIIHTLFSPLCHQLPERSFFCMEPQATYSLEQLANQLGGALVPPRFAGSAAIGWKMAICQRCTAIYGAMFLASLTFYLVRTRLKPLSIRQFVIFLVPLAIDGFGQLLGFWESSWVSRLITGTAFGLAIIWLTFPYLQRGMSEVHRGTTPSPE